MWFPRLPCKLTVVPCCLNIINTSKIADNLPLLKHVPIHLGTEPWWKTPSRQVQFCVAMTLWQPTDTSSKRNARHAAENETSSWTLRPKPRHRVFYFSSGTMSCRGTSNKLEMIRPTSPSPQPLCWSPPPQSWAPNHQSLTHSGLVLQGTPLSWMRRRLSWSIE